MFGIKREDLEQGLAGLYDKVVSYVRDNVLSPLSAKDAELEGRVGGLERHLERQLGEAAAANTLLRATTTQLAERLMGYEQRLHAVEQNQQKSGILSEAVKPKGEVTFNDVASLAREASDTAYVRIRDYFLLEMAKKGYEGEQPDFFIWDNDSHLGVYFSVTDEQQRPHNNGSSVLKTSVYLENIPKLEERAAQRDNTEKVMFSREGFDNYRDWFLLSVRSNSKSDWTKKLRDELPELFQAYMLGYSLKCLDQKKFGVTLQVQEKHGLKENPALLARMSEVMQKDPRLATMFVAHYGAAPIV